jgi:flavin reductase
MNAADDALGEAYRNTLRRFASTVNVISICVDGQPMGVTATAVSGLSFDPPSLLVCINRAASLHAPMGDMSHFRINVLHRDQEGIARMFADRSQHALRFLSGWDLEGAGAPRLLDAQATILCRRIDSHSFGTHSIFIGLVEAAEARDSVDPLVYLDGRYGGADVA